MGINLNSGITNQIIPESKSLLLKPNHLNGNPSNDSKHPNELVNTDVFESSNESETVAAAGIYSRIAIKGNNDGASEVSTVQLSSNTSTTVNYYDVIKYRAAKKAGATLLSNGSIYMPSQSASSLYQAEYNRIQGTFWCQTGGWSNLNGDGSQECLRTASATMASINSGYTVTPNDTTGNSNGLTGITVNGHYVSYNSAAGTYNPTSGPATGLNKYNCGNEDGVISAINNELKNGRCVLVKTAVSGQHWVTVTGTIDGKPAESFDDFVGVDPWYNGSNPNNPTTGTGNFSSKAAYSGVFQLSNVTNQTIHSDCVIITYKD